MNSHWLACQPCWQLAAAKLKYPLEGLGIESPFDRRPEHEAVEATEAHLCQCHAPSVIPSCVLQNAPKLELQKQEAAVSTRVLTSWQPRSALRQRGTATLTTRYGLSANLTGKNVAQYTQLSRFQNCGNCRLAICSKKGTLNA